MSRSRVKNIDLDIEIDVMTSGALAEIVTSIFEFLLYQRNQIEFVYRIFRTFVNEWSLDGIETSSSIKNYMLGRQREKATETKDSISAMRSIIIDTLEGQTVKSIRFLLGATTISAKEIYTIHLPTETISTFHLYDHHQIPNMRVNQMLLTLLTKEELADVFSMLLSPTNLFLEFELCDLSPNSASPSSIPRMYQKQTNRIPSSCKDIHIHLRHKSPSSVHNSQQILNCCKEIAVFEDLSFVEDSSTPSYLEHKTLKAEMKTSWWETDIIVRGFKEKLIKGKSIWTK